MLNYLALKAALKLARPVAYTVAAAALVLISIAATAAATVCEERGML